MPLPNDLSRYNMPLWYEIFRKAYTDNEVRVPCKSPGHAVNQRQKAYKILKLIRNDAADLYPEVYRWQMEKPFSITLDRNEMVIRSEVDPMEEFALRLRDERTAAARDESNDDFIKRMTDELEPPNVPE